MTRSKRARGRAHAADEAQQRRPSNRGLPPPPTPTPTHTYAQNNNYSPHIEGAAVDKEGNLYAVNFDRRGAAVGRAAAASGACSSGPPAAVAGDVEGSHLNGLRVLPDGSILGADLAKKRVVLMKPPSPSSSSGSGSGGGSGSSSGSGLGATAVSVFCSDPGMIAPNDLAVSPATGFVYVSGQRWSNGDNAVGDGDVWLCRGAGKRAVR